MKTLTPQGVTIVDGLHQQEFVAALSLTLVTLGAGLVFSSSLVMKEAQAAGAGHREANLAASEMSRTMLPRALGRIPMSFSPNQGQADPRVKFLSQGPGHKLSLSPTEAMLTLSPPVARRSSDAQAARGVSFQMRLVGGNRNAGVEGLEELPGKSNYFIGNDPKKWRTNVPTFARVKYREVYPGVDLVYYGNQQQLEYDLLVATRVDPGVIKLSFDNAKRLEIAANGDLVVSTGGGEVRQLKPAVFQEAEDGKRESVECRYVLKGRREVGLALGRYDRERPLVIDPLLVYSTTGIGGDRIAVDSAGNVYLTGSASIQATPGAFESAFGAFVAKVNASGTALVYATNLGGSGVEWGSGLEVDAAGSVYVTGATNSPDFPISGGAVQSRFGGGVCPTSNDASSPCTDVFVAKLNATGSALIYSTYLGGTGRDLGSGIRADSAGNAYIAGSTESVDFPATNGAFQTMYAGNVDAFVTKLNPTGTDLIYSTFLGTGDWESAADIALDAAGEVYVAGISAYGFPTTPGAFTTPYGNFFVIKLNATGTAPVYSSCFTLNLGFGDFDSIAGIAIDSVGNAYVTGSYSLPSSFSAFVLKLNSTGSAPVYSVSLGGVGFGADIAVDHVGNAYVTGDILGPMPVTVDAIQKEPGGGTCFNYFCADAFIAKLSPSGAVLYASYFGGNGADAGHSLAIDPTGAILITGYAGSPDFLTTPGSYHSSAGVGSFLLKLAPGVSSVSAAHYNISPIARSAIVAAFGLGFASGTETASSIPLPTSLSGSQVLIKDSAGVDHPAPLYYVSPTQINYQVPAGVALGPALVTVTSGDGHTSTGLMTIASVAPALFTLDQSGSGAAAALDALTLTGAPFAARRSDGQPNIIALFGTGLGADATDLTAGVDVSSSVEITIDGSPTTVVFAGSAPGFTGLNQFNVVLPVGVSSGDHQVVVARNGVKSNRVTIAIR
jgi:uncharacterized protein (TIGR03437 family)